MLNNAIKNFTKAFEIKAKNKQAISQTKKQRIVIIIDLFVGL